VVAVAVLALLVSCGGEAGQGTGASSGPSTAIPTTTAPLETSNVSTSTVAESRRSDLIAYFVALEAAGVAYADAGFRIDEALSDGGDGLDAARSAFPEFLDALRTFVATLNALMPPAEAAASHREAVERGRSAVEAFESVVDEIDHLDPDTPLERFFVGPTWDAATVAGYDLWRSCSDLQAIAIELGVGADLHCS